MTRTEPGARFVGKPYQLELRSLPETYDAAMSLDVDALARSLSNYRSLPLVAIGSGGSFTAAHFAAWLHERYAGTLARPATPLDAVDAVASARETAVMLLSAGGSNPDVCGAFRLLAETEPAQLGVICGQTDSPLALAARSYGYVDLFAFQLESGKDGFLATNSLFAFAALLARGYARSAGIDDGLPNTLTALAHPGRSPAAFTKDLSSRMAPLWTRPTLVVLYGPETSSAAVDIESKFTEAALGVVQLADLRNFAHGRHHWLAKHGTSSAILALATERDLALAKRTLDIIPDTIPRVLQKIEGHGVASALSAMVIALHVAGLAGMARGIDPGRPGVPAFGRKIYNLRTFRTRARSVGPLTPAGAIAVERKAGTTVESLKRRGELTQWAAAYRQFIRRLYKATFGAVVLDYDGTLCDTRSRTEGLRSEVAEELVRVLELGVALCVVTGRGRSVRNDLQREIPAKYWDRIVIGYYNGSDLGSLSDTTRPEIGPPSATLEPVARMLSCEGSLAQMCDAEPRPMQISVTAKGTASQAALWEALERAVFKCGTGARVVRSGHSFDVLAATVSKAAAVDCVTRDGLAVLCIGDRGRWPGNDFALLAGAYSLSSHEVSSDPGSCWNLAPAGRRGVEATLHYLRGLRRARVSGGVTLRLRGHDGKASK